MSALERLITAVQAAASPQATVDERKQAIAVRGNSLSCCATWTYSFSRAARCTLH